MLVTPILMFDVFMVCLVANPGTMWFQVWTPCCQALIVIAYCLVLQDSKCTWMKNIHGWIFFFNFTEPVPVLLHHLHYCCSHRHPIVRLDGSPFWNMLVCMCVRARLRVYVWKVVLKRVCRLEHLINSRTEVSVIPLISPLFGLEIPMRKKTSLTHLRSDVINFGSVQLNAKVDSLEYFLFVLEICVSHSS